jgi:hypothetical protein
MSLAAFMTPSCTPLQTFPFSSPGFTCLNRNRPWFKAALADNLHCGPAPGAASAPVLFNTMGVNHEFSQ